MLPLAGDWSDVFDDGGRRPADPMVGGLAHRRRRDAHARLASLPLPLPDPAATSDGAVEARSFPGATLTLLPARHNGQVHPRIRLEVQGEGGFVLMTGRPDGSPALCLLPGADAAGGILAVLAPATPADTGLRACLRDSCGSAALIPTGAG